MEHITVVRAQRKDAGAIFELYKQTVHESFHEWTAQSKDLWLSEYYSLSFWNDLLAKEHIPVFLAYRDNKAVGYAAVETVTFGVAYLSWIGVLHDIKHMGVGSSLIRSVEEWCKHKNIHKIELETQIESLQPFFKKHGYNPEGIRKNSWQNLDNYLFGKEI